jgi:hypothetical protein
MKKILLFIYIIACAFEIHGKDKDELSRSPEFGTSKINIFAQINDDIKEFGSRVTDAQAFINIVDNKELNENFIQETINSFRSQVNEIHQAINNNYINKEITHSQRNILREKLVLLSGKISRLMH